MERMFRKFGMIVVILAVFAGTPAFCQDAPAEKAEAPAVNNMVAIAMAASIAAGVLGAGFAVGKVGSAAVGAMAERPELGTRALLYVALAEGIAVWGIVGAALMMGKL